MAIDPFRQLDVMRNIVNSGKKVTDCYRLMYNKKLWLHALATIGEARTSNHLQLIDEIIKNLTSNTFRLAAQERLKENLVKEVVRIILTSIYSPSNSSPSHVNRGDYYKHSALLEIKHNWSTLTWVIKGECSILPLKMDKQLLLDVLSEKITDQRFLLLIHHLITSVTLNEERNLIDMNKNLSLYSILISIYLHHLDLFMEKIERPFKACTKDIKKNAIDHYIKVGKLTYIRYAGEFLIGISASKQQAKDIKNNVELYLRTELKLIPRKDVSLKLTHFENSILFLDYSLRIHKTGDKNRAIYKKTKENQNKKSLASKIRLEIPREKIVELAFHNNYGNINTFIATSRKNLLYRSELNILRKYNAELKAISYYYKLADNYHHLRRLYSLAQASFLKTIARKRRSTVSRVAKNLKKHEQGMYCLSSYDRDGIKQLHAFIKFGKIKNNKYAYIKNSQSNNSQG